MNTNQNKIPKSKLEKEIDKLGDMFDATLAKGDDEYYEATKSVRGEQKKEEQVPRSKRRAKRM